MKIYEMPDRDLIQEALVWSDDEIIPTDAQDVLRELAGRLSFKE